MTPLGWLALAVVVVSFNATSTPVRVGALSASARLCGPPQLSTSRVRLPLRRLAIAGGTATIGVVFWNGGAALGMAAAAALGLAAVLARDHVCGRAEVRRRTAFVASIRVLVAELEAGSRPGMALRAAAIDAGEHAHGAAFELAAVAADSGGDAAQPLLDVDETRAVGVAWRLGEQTGVALAAVLARVAADLDADSDQRRAVTVVLAGPKSSAAVLTGLPLLGMAMGFAMGAHPLDFLTAPGAGRLVCCAGVLLDVGGVLWVRRIVRSAQQA